MNKRVPPADPTGMTIARALGAYSVRLRETTRYGGPTPLILAAAAFLPLVAWGIYASLRRWFAPALCGPPPSAWLYTLAAIALAGAIMGGIVAWQGDRRTPRRPENAGREMIAARYFGVVGLIASALFGIAIVMQTSAFRTACLG